MVVTVCLNSVSELLRRHLLSAPIAVSFLSRCLSLTCHPLTRIRQNAIGFFATFARRASTRKFGLAGARDSCHPFANTYCSGMWTSSGIHARLANSGNLKAFFRRPVENSFAKDAVLLSALRPPINRSVFDAFVSMITNPSLVSSTAAANSCKNLLNDFFDLLAEREASREITRTKEIPCYTTASNENANLILSKLQALGLSERTEFQMLHLRPNIQALCEFSREKIQAVSSRLSTNNCIHFQCIRTRLIDTQRLTHFPSTLNEEECLSWRLQFSHKHLVALTSALQSGVTSYENTIRRDCLSGYLPVGADTNYNQNRPQLFGRGLSVSVPASDQANAPAQIPENMRSARLAQTSDLASSSLERSSNPLSSGIFRLESQLAHLHEHSAGYLSLAVHTSGRLMASCSSGDGAVKLWNIGSWPVESDAYLTTQSNSSHISPSTDSLTKIAGTKISRFMQNYSLPTHSSWTYYTAAAGETPRGCRGLLWTVNGTNLATTVGKRWLHLINVATGQQCGLRDLLGREIGCVVCVQTPAQTQFPAILNFAQPRFVGGADANVLAYSTTENRILGRDLRLSFNSSPAWSIQQDQNSGLIRSLALHSCHTWLVSGTSRGQLTCWDLRYQRPVTNVRHKSTAQASIVRLTFCDSVSSNQLNPEKTNDGKSPPNTRKQTVVIAATDRNHGLLVWDLESCTSATVAQRTASVNFTAAPTPVDGTGLLATFEADAVGYCPVRSIISIPSSSSCCQDKAQLLPSVITGDKDGRIRYLDFTQNTYRIAAFGEGSNQASSCVYRERYENGTTIIQEVEEPVGTEKIKSGTQGSGLLVANRQQHKSAPGKPNQIQNAEPFPLEGSLEIYEPPVGHGNVISDISLLRASNFLLVSASMDGVIKIWQ